MHSKLTWIILTLLLFLSAISVTNAQLPIGGNLIGARIDWHPSGSMLAVGNGTTVQIINSNNQVLNTLPSFSSAITAVVWNSDGSNLSIASSFEVQIWNEPWNVSVTEPQFIITVPSNGGVYGVVSLDWHPTEPKLLAVSPPDIHIWDTNSGQLLQTIGPIQSPSLSAVWSPSGAKLAIGDLLGGILVANLTDGTSEFEEVFDRNGIFSLAWSPQGDELAAGNGSGLIQMLVLSPFFAGNGTIETQVQNILALSWNPVNVSLLASGSEDGKVIVWDLETRLPIEEYSLSVPAASLGWSPDGSKLAFGGDSGTVEIVPAPGAAPENGRLAFFSNRDGDWEIYSMNPDGTGLLKLTHNPVADRSPDGRVLAAQLRAARAIPDS